jgi:acetolactate synthase-1/2/3 large subunit
VHYARAWAELKRRLAALLAARHTSLGGKAHSPRTTSLSLGSGGNAIQPVVTLRNADLIFGIGCSFTKTNFGVDMPQGKAIVHATLDPMDINKDVACEQALIGDAKLVLEALLGELESQVSAPRDPAPVADEIKAVREPWLASGDRLTSDGAAEPVSRFRRPRAHVDLDNTIVTTTPAARATSCRRSGVDRTLSYIGRGKTAARLRAWPRGREAGPPRQLCINVWVTSRSASPAWTSRPRCRAHPDPRSNNNFCMAIELVMPSTEHARDRHLERLRRDGARVRQLRRAGHQPDEIVPAIRRDIAATERGSRRCSSSSPARRSRSRSSSNARATWMTGGMPGLQQRNTLQVGGRPASRASHLDETERVWTSLRRRQDHRGDCPAPRERIGARDRSVGRMIAFAHARCRSDHPNLAFAVGDATALSYRGSSI